MPAKKSEAELQEIISNNKNTINQQYDTIEEANKGKRGGIAFLQSHNVCILRKGVKGEWWFRLPKEFSYTVGMQYDEIHEWLVQHNKPCSAEVFHNQFLNPDRFSVQNAAPSSS